MLEKGGHGSMHTGRAEFTHTWKSLTQGYMCGGLHLRRCTWRRSPFRHARRWGGPHFLGNRQLLPI
eukprot:scaffold153803_cov22-Tisochrysis_lutea.AAC.2